MAGRSIRIFLVDGAASGIMTAEIMNWIGKVIVAPRSQLAPLAQRSEARRTGLYILAGDDPNSPLKEQVYIGESDNVLSRLTQHNTDSTKDFWSRTVVVISKDENLTKAHVRYLESRLIQVATTANRATLTNGTAPIPTSLPEPDIADMEFFLEQLLLLLPVLNFSFANPTPTVKAFPSTSVAGTTGTVALSTGNSPTFVASSREYSAEAQEINGQFIVMKGSRARKTEKQSLGDTYVDMRTEFLRDGRLIAHSDGVSLEFTADVPFKSPSAAANVVTGTSVNGRDFWKVQGSSQTYNQWDQNRVNATAQAANTGSTAISSS